MSKHYNFIKFCYLCNSSKSHTNQNVIIQQLLITTICVNRFHQSMTGRLTKNTAYILCNRFISLTDVPLDIDGHLVGFILHKRSSTYSCHYIPIVKIGDLWFECYNVKINKIECNNFFNPNAVYMFFYKRSARWKH